MPTPTEQLLSRTLYDTDGTTTIWDFSFASGYLDPSHVKAYTTDDAGVVTDITVTTGMLVGEFQLQITPALSAGDVLTIYRDTPKNAPLVDFTDESGFSEIALDTNAKQAIMVAAEIADLTNYSRVEDLVAGEAVARIAGDTALSGRITTLEVNGAHYTHNDTYDSLKISTAATASGTRATAIGKSSIGVGSIASGNGAFSVNGGLASATGSIAIGAFSTASASQAVSLGEGTTASGLYSTSVGSYSTALGTSSVALGGGYADGAQSIAIGAFGNFIHGAHGENSIALAYHSKANGARSIAIGYESQALADDAIVLGEGSAGTYGFAVNGSASGDDSIAIKGHAQGNNSTVIRGYANKSASLALGLFANSESVGKHAYGHGTAFYSRANSAQRGDMLLLGITTGDGTQVLTADQLTPEAANQLGFMGLGLAYFFTADIVGLGVNGVVFAKTIKGLAFRRSDDVVVVTNLSNELLTTAGACSVALTADNTLKCVKVEVTSSGIGAVQVNWLCHINTLEVRIQ